ncbi:hypothetical protein L6164_019800 [Bauhinia variegata]|uniref:Uncharacterized protein n=1 Tax=Bauhinia variegata TaxID=167791 RepID=A0ACB9MUC7_BAUVA|nr:hypothetical protein L6164_019800 [Bauhinia variegata]
MEAYSGSSSSSKSAYPYQFQPQSQSLQFLHSVRKVNAKPWKKHAVAPLPPTPLKVYKVDPMNFRNLVQQLTGAPEFQNAVPSLNVASAALPPKPSRDVIDIAASSPSPYAWSTPKSTLSNNNNGCYQGMESEALGMKSASQESMIGSGSGSASLLELNLLSPSSYNWFLPSYEPCRNQLGIWQGPLVYTFNYCNYTFQLITMV